MFQRIDKSPEDGKNAEEIEQGILKLSEDHQKCVRAMREGTDEAQKVLRNGGQIWHAIYKKISVAEIDQKKVIDKFL